MQPPSAKAFTVPSCPQLYSGGATPLGETLGIPKTLHHTSSLKFFTDPCNFFDQWMDNRCFDFTENFPF
jgi:hypothetical protein